VPVQTTDHLLQEIELQTLRDKVLFSICSPFIFI
jgi:hypothetical protein